MCDGACGGMSAPLEVGGLGMAYAGHSTDTGTSQAAVMPCSREGNCRSGIALAYIIGRVRHSSNSPTRM